MSLQQEVGLLRNIPLFAKIDPSKLKLIAFTADKLKYQAGDVLFNQGEIGDSAYIIMEGEADVLVNRPDGPLNVATLKTNDIVGEIAILCDVPRTATVKAKSELTTLCISKDYFFQLLCEFPDVAVALMRELAHRVEETTAKLREATANS